MAAPTRKAIKAACDALSQIDPALARAYDEIGLPIWRDRPPVYATIATTIAHQQISVKAAASIWARVEAGLGEITPEIMLATSEETLRSFGLSRPKVAHLKSVAQAIGSGALNLSRVQAASIDEARAELLSVKGIGPWTAELFLLYALGQMDALPTADLGIMEAHKQLSGAPERMKTAAFSAYAERWRPWRGAATHLLWAWLGAQRAGA